MTAQIPHKLESMLSDFSIGVWELYGVIRGQPRDSPGGWGTFDPTIGRPVRVYTSDPATPDLPRTSCNWDGHIEVYRLDRDGMLVLVRFEYPFLDVDLRWVNERLTGDFQLVLKASFENVRQYVPFRDSTFVLDRSAWLHEASIGDSPLAREIRAGAHPDFPTRAPPLWYERDQ